MKGEVRRYTGKLYKVPNEGCTLRGWKIGFGTLEAQLWICVIRAKRKLLNKMKIMQAGLPNLQKALVHNGKMWYTIYGDTSRCSIRRRGGEYTKIQNRTE